MLAAAGCGEVESGVCAGEQVDEVACTVDICDGEAKAWAHIPDNSLCGAGMRCDPTAGCVASGALTGRALLLGKTDHSGITVTAEGTEASTTTGADGSWTLSGLAPGMYKVTYSKAKYFPQSETGLAVTVEAAVSAPTVELSHADDEIADDLTGLNQVLFSPDKTYAVYSYSTPFGTVAYSAKLDGSADPVVLTGSFSNGRVTNTHLVWQSNGAVWSRPLTGATAPVRLGYNTANLSVGIVGTPGTYTLMQKSGYNPTLGSYEYQYWIAKTDGSVAPAATPVLSFNEGGANYPSFAVSNDTHALVGINNYGAGNANSIHRIDLASNTEAALNLGGNWNYVSLSATSPDGNNVYGILTRYSPSQWQRGFLMPIASATLSAAPALGADYGAGSGGYQYSEYGPFYGWLADSSAVVFGTYNYPLSVGGSAGGEMKAWFTTTAAPTVLAAFNTYNPNNVTLVGRAALYSDASNNGLKAVSVQVATPTPVTLDATALGNLFRYTSTTASSGYVVWGQATASGTGAPLNKLFAANLNFPLTTATPVQLGGTIPATCAFQGALSNTTFYHLCTNTGLLTAYTQSTSTAAGTLTGVYGNLTPLPTANRLGFAKDDGSFYSAPNSGDLSTSVVLTTKLDAGAGVFDLGNYVAFRDTQRQLTRISKADGSVVDEPLFHCEVNGYNPFFDTTMTQLWAPGVRCSTNDAHLMRVPVANLP